MFYVPLCSMLHTSPNCGYTDVVLLHDLKLKICCKTFFNMLIYIIQEAIQLILIVHCALNAVNVYLQGAYNTI